VGEDTRVVQRQAKGWFHPEVGAGVQKTIVNAWFRDILLF
jgi:hypothetical protein